MTQISCDQPKIAVFAGSFNPFTIGHASVLERALPLFDRIIIAVGANRDKDSTTDSGSTLEAIKKYCEKFPAGKTEVIDYSDELTVDLARRLGANFLLRGVRSVKDFEYERDLADINRRIGGLETIILFTEPEYAAISSSVVRELTSYGYDVSSMLP